LLLSNLLKFLFRHANIRHKAIDHKQFLMKLDASSSQTTRVGAAFLAAARIGFTQHLNQRLNPSKLRVSPSQYWLVENRTFRSKDSQSKTAEFPSDPEMDVWSLPFLPIFQLH
jgi:hypothetical protein